MTDNEIIKALECCSDDEPHFCSVCPYYLQDKENDYCREDMNKDALSLINRQKAEKEALIAGQETLQKYIAEQGAEIERLVKHTKGGVDLAKQLPETLKLAQAETIKEFAERLLLEFPSGSFSYSHIRYKANNLVKEMVGDD